MLLLLIGNLGMGGGGGEVVPDPEVVVKTGTGGIDPPGRGRGKHIVKPTGLRGTLHLPKKASPSVDERVEESRGLQAEVAAKLARDFADGNAALREREALTVPIVRPLTEMEAEIAALLRKKIRTEEEELMVLMLMLSVAA